MSTLSKLREDCIRREKARKEELAVEFLAKILPEVKKGYITEKHYSKISLPCKENLPLGVENEVRKLLIRVCGYLGIRLNPERFGGFSWQTRKEGKRVYSDCIVNFCWWDYYE